MQFIQSMQRLFTRYTEISEKATKCSLVIANKIGQRQLPFQHGELAKEVLTEFVEEFCPGKKEALESISLSRHTEIRRIETLSKDIERKLKEVESNFIYFSIALDESTDNSDIAQLAIMVRGIDDQFSITEDFLTMSSLHGTTTGQDTFDNLLKELEDFNLPLEKLSGICTDGAPAMTGEHTGLIGLLMKSRVWNVPPIVYHCIIHQENLGAQHLKMGHVMELVVSTVNYIRARALSHRQFKEMLKEIEAEFQDVTYYCKVRWLSSAKTLRRFLSLLDPIDTFMRGKGRNHEEFRNVAWINDLAFLADITEHMADLKRKLQGKQQHVSSLWSHITAFRCKLNLWVGQLQNGNCTHFKSLLERQQSVENHVSAEPYAKLLTGLAAEFGRRFAQFDGTCMHINIFEDPFSVDAKEAPAPLQMELIDIQADKRLSQHHNSHELVEFYRDFLPKQRFPGLYKHALLMGSLFGSTYLCEQFFSRMKHTKNKYRTTITDEHLTQKLRLASSATQPDIDRIVREKQCQVSH
ncbi:general transcription factor II-I repeat domain-containing protein 2A-like [Watersipora subatra]|uniref:general transcription factor II-I repeat domain-containing protein 2A-like n=1 Tax=Watersipora subatra TaxID=2589382 RepID=UPI00355B37B3